MSKLNDLLESEGFEDEIEFAETYVLESIVPGICMNPACSNVYEYEPDQNEGWCDCCASNTVKSGLILAGMI